MDEQTRETLRKAYDLIKTGDKDGARTLIKPVLTDDQDNIDAWWLAAHAAVVPHDIRLAVCQVLRLNPDHRPAQLLLAKLNRDHPLSDALVTQEQPVVQLAPRVPSFHLRRRQAIRVLALVSAVIVALAILALILALFRIGGFDEHLWRFANTFGLASDSILHGDRGTVSGGYVTAPRDIPITQRKALKAGHDSSGTLAADKAHLWTFSSQEGQQIQVEVQFATPGDAHYVLELWNTKRQKIANGVGASASGTVTLTYTLSRPGDYGLVLIGRPNGPQGRYTIRLDVGTP